MKHNNIFRDFIRRAAVLLSALFVIATTAWAACKPVFGYNLIEPDDGFIHIKGWAYDPDNPDYSIDIVVYVFDDANYSHLAGNGYYVVKANLESPNVRELQDIPGNHGFEYIIPLDPGDYWLETEAYNKGNTLSTTLEMGKVSVETPESGLVTLTPETGYVFLGDGSILTGTGGSGTFLAIASGAKVTFSDMDITAISSDCQWPGITCLGNATIILDKGTTNYVRGGYGYPGIKAGPKGTTLTIGGSGSLDVSTNGGFSSTIGSHSGRSCGNIVIEGGNINVVTGYERGPHDFYVAYGAGIGPGEGGSCGNITIKGGNITAKAFSTAAIGSSENGKCGNITITGGNVTAICDKLAAAIGSCREGACGNISISGFTCVTAKKGYNYTQEVIRVPYVIGPGNTDNGATSICGTLTIGGVVTDYISESPYTYAPTDIPYTVKFNANGGEGEMEDQNFFSNTPQELRANTFTLNGKYLSHWNTMANGEGYDYANGELVNNLGNVTLYAQWRDSYTIHFDANGGEGEMEDQQTMALNQVLNANAFTLSGYTFIGWNTEADGSGTSYSDEETVTLASNVTLYAQWQITNYNITYNLDGGTNDNGNPATYTIESDDITLAEPTRFGYDFTGWTWKEQNEPTTSVTIAQGSTGDKTFTAHWKPGTVMLTPEVGSYALVDGQTLTGTGGENTHITISDGATVTLSGANITAISKYNHWAGITCEGDATIILSDGTTNYVNGNSGQFPAIFIPVGKTLTIRGNGTLNANSNSYGAGIGAGLNINCGNIIIEGGTITASGGSAAAGIGGAPGGACGNITITSGVTSVTASRGWNAPNSIGAGNSSCGTVTIGGRETGSIATSPYTYEPAETALYTITFNANGGEGTMEAQTLASNIPQALTANAFTRTGYIFMGWSTAANGSGPGYSDGQIVTNTGSVTLYAQWSPYNDITMISTTGYLVLNDGQSLSGTGGANTHIAITDGATVTLKGANITDIANDDRHKWAGISCLGDATIILADGTTNSVKGGHEYYPGIHVPVGKTLTIRGTGTLNASGNGVSCGIGGGNSIECGNIAIEGGIINATAVGTGAGIGGGNVGQRIGCGNITITGGTINAKGDVYGAGIGGVLMCADITITDGVTSVTAIKGSSAVSCIGAGGTSYCGTVTIGGRVTGSVPLSTYTYKPTETTFYTITFDANEGEGTMDDQIVPSNIPQALTANAFTRTYYEFIGWNTAADGSGTGYTDGQKVTNTGNVTLYAQWKDLRLKTIDNKSTDVELVDNDCVSGTGGKNTHVTIADGATVTLNGVNITQINNYSSCQWAGITCLGNATIILSGENAVKGGYKSAGITVPEGKTLTIRGDGSLSATGGDHAAGIGCGENGSCGDILIMGGTVTATGGSYAAGIGCGNGSYKQNSICGIITIRRSVSSVTATKGSNAQHSIGLGKNYGSCGTVVIGGIETGGISDSPYTYTPNSTSIVHFDANDGSGEIYDWQFTCDGTAQTIPDCVFTKPIGYNFLGWNTEANGNGTWYKDGQQIYDIPDVTLYAQWRLYNVEITSSTEAIMLYDGQMLTGTGGLNTHVTIADGATMTICNVDITSISNDNGHKWAGISCEGDATIILKGNNTVNGGYFSAGITVPEGKTLTIRGDGLLTATGGYGSAGIGSGNTKSCGNITIEGGIVTATGQYPAAGIGSGDSGSCGNITISGGNITATGHNHAAGIGGGGFGSCGKITIEGGVNSVIATSGDFCDNPIGRGDEGSCGTITIGDGLDDVTIDNTRYITVPDWIGTTSVTLAKEGYGTYYNGLLDLVLPAGMKAHIVTASANGGQLTYETIADGNTSNNTVPAKTGVMLQATAADNVQTIDIGIMVPTAVAISQTNLLGGSDMEMMAVGYSMDEKFYKLTYNQNGENLGWYWGNKNGGRFLSAAHKAWLALPPTAAAREFFGLPENYDSEDGIESIDNGQLIIDNEAIYNLSGQKLSRPQKGINIVNGKKILF